MPILEICRVQQSHFLARPHYRDELQNQVKLYRDLCMRKVLPLRPDNNGRAHETSTPQPLCSTSALAGNLGREPSDNNERKNIHSTDSMIFVPKISDI